MRAPAPRASLEGQEPGVLHATRPEDAPLETRAERGSFDSRDQKPEQIGRRAIVHIALPGWPIRGSSAAQALEEADLAFRTKQREQNHVPNRLGIGQDHGEVVDADAFASRGRHRIGERSYIVFVHHMRFHIAAGLALELLFETARSLIREKGYEHTTLEDIVERA